ncbi:MAG: argininosuccinate lyase [Desulfobacterales bacterium]|nr:argininosuccinate lyase [Desulfobacterales bacterium]
MSDKAWGGRFAEATDKAVEAFTSSIHFDKLLYCYDIEGSIAHCKMLAKTSIISEDEASSIIDGLKTIQTEIEKGEFTFDDRLEDIHMHIENRLHQIIGGPALKLHTARSRNDQVALDIRLYLRNEVSNIIEGLKQLRTKILEIAKENINIILPGYTHLQRAQPVLLSHHFMAYYEMFSRDSDRFFDGLKRINVMPLGSAALAGTTYPIDRTYTASILNFNEISKNSIDSVSDRDFIIEFLSAASICMIHFSRMSEELILWSSSEFKFIEISDSFTTGSSIMPQKKNPDIAELSRGKTSRIFGSLICLLTLMKSLPLSYNRDMQEDKEPLFDTVKTLTSCIDIFIRMLPNIKFNKEKMQQSALTGYLNATDMADYLVTKGVPFRNAHALTGKIVSYALNKQKELHELSLGELNSFSDLFNSDIFDFLSLQSMIDRRQSFGGTAKKNVIAAINEAEKELN